MTEEVKEQKTSIIADAAGVPEDVAREMDIDELFKLITEKEGLNSEEIRSIIEFENLMLEQYKALITSQEKLMKLTVESANEIDECVKFLRQPGYSLRERKDVLLRMSTSLQNSEIYIPN